MILKCVNIFSFISKMYILHYRLVNAIFIIKTPPTFPWEFTVHDRILISLCRFSCSFTAKGLLWFLTWPARRWVPGGEVGLPVWLMIISWLLLFTRQTDIFIQLTMSWVTVLSVLMEGPCEAQLMPAITEKRGTGSRPSFTTSAVFPAWRLMGGRGGHVLKSLDSSGTPTCDAPDES